jgi:hypothetical protein
MNGEEMIRAMGYGVKLAYTMVSPGLDSFSTITIFATSPELVLHADRK